jgi:hypothetical protein
MHFEHENGKRVTTALFDGYPVGDRLLDGVLFECEIVDEKVIVKGVIKEDKEYFDTLNTERWLKKVTEYVQDYDVFQDQDGNDIYKCPPCDSTVWSPNPIVKPMNVLNVEVQGVRIIVVSGNPRPPESSPLDHVSYTYCFFPNGVTAHEYQAKWEEKYSIPPEQVVPLIENVILLDGRNKWVQGHQITWGENPRQAAASCLDLEEE